MTGASSSALISVVSAPTGRLSCTVVWRIRSIGLAPLSFIVLISFSICFTNGGLTSDLLCMARAHSVRLLLALLLHFFTSVWPALSLPLPLDLIVRTDALRRHSTRVDISLTHYAVSFASFLCASSAVRPINLDSITFTTCMHTLSRIA